MVARVSLYIYIYIYIYIYKETLATIKLCSLEWLNDPEVEDPILNHFVHILLDSLIIYEH